MAALGAWRGVPGVSAWTPSPNAPLPHRLSARLASPSCPAPCLSPAPSTLCPRHPTPAACMAPASNPSNPLPLPPAPTAADPWFDPPKDPGTPLQQPACSPPRTPPAPLPPSAHSGTPLFGPHLPRHSTRHVVPRYPALAVCITAAPSAPAPSAPSPSPAPHHPQQHALGLPP